MFIALKIPDPYMSCLGLTFFITQGKKPEAFYLVKDPEVRAFVEKCLATVTSRLTALELLQDPFLQAKQPRDRDGDRKLGRERGWETSNLKFVDTGTA